MAELWDNWLHCRWLEAISYLNVVAEWLSFFFFKPLLLMLTVLDASPRVVVRNRLRIMEIFILYFYLFTVFKARCFTSVLMFRHQPITKKWHF